MGQSILLLIITLLTIGAVIAIFFVVIDRVSKDAALTQIAKIALGVTAIILVLLAAWNALFGGGGSSPVNWHGLITFAAGAIGIVIVLFIIDKLLSWLAGAMGIGAPLVEIASYIIFGVALIALLVLTDRTLLGGSITEGNLMTLPTPRISR